MQFWRAQPEIEKNKQTLDLDKEKEQKIAVMFTDISGFTKLSEGMKAFEGKNLANRSFEM